MIFDMANHRASVKPPGPNQEGSTGFRVGTIQTSPLEVDGGLEGLEVTEAAGDILGL